ncbi:GntR family transcriptional regulator [Actinomadura rubrisoli]|uniref:GntR family transcriptional regulator n=1 Tax=Actinomadura rubrisoli TaxID=2530368 RepID=A0A4R5A648_9ACTN|nr:GntR family transcriptional regulator [Actinomadura rubrisoli]
MAGAGAPPHAAGAPALADARRLRADRARQVADVLRRQVLYGEFRSGTLPAEAELVRDFGASRNTVRVALDLLRAEGLVERCPGVGTVVVAEKYPHGLERLLGLAETLREHGEVANEVRTTGLITPSREISSRLRLPDGEPVVYIERVRRLNGTPLSLDLTYVSRDLGEPLLAEDLAHNDVFVLLERIAGQPLGRADVTLEAVNADPHSAATLDAPRGTALLMLERLTHLADGRPVDLEFIRFRGDRITMSGSMSRT